MPQWKNDIEAHSIHETIEILRDDIKELLPLIDKDSNDSLKRVLQILEKGMKILAGGDPAFISTVTLDAIQANIAAVTTSFNDIKTHATSPSLHKTYFDQMEPHLSQILINFGQMRSVTANLSQNSAFEKLGFIKLDAAAQASKIKASFQEEVDEIEESLTQINDKLTEVTTSVSEEKLRADSLITQFQTDFNTGQKERDSLFKKKLEKEFSEKIESTVTDAQSDFVILENRINEKVGDLDKNSERLMTLLEGHITKAGLVAQAIAQKALKTEYENTAIEERKAATKWSRFTIGISAFMILFVAAVVIKAFIDDKPFAPEAILQKALLTAVLIGVARWTAKLERRHTEEARKYKQLSLEFETMAPFIATLSKDDQQTITKTLVDRYFIGRNPNTNEKQTDDAESFGHPTESASDAIKNLLPGKQ